MPSSLGPRPGAQGGCPSSLDAALNLGDSFMELVEIDASPLAAARSSRVERKKLLLLQTLYILNIGRRENAGLVELVFDIVSWIVTNQKTSENRHGDG